MFIAMKGGHRVMIQNPDFSTVPNLEFIIARCLARIPRYCGHTSGNYTVAEHSVLVCQALKAAGYSAEVQMQGLMHDATEAFVSDIPRPVKIHLIGIDTIEHNFWIRIADHFGINPVIAGVVKEFDLRICINESKEFFGPHMDFEIPAEPLPNIQFHNMYESVAYGAFVHEFVRLKTELKLKET